MAKSTAETTETTTAETESTTTKKKKKVYAKKNVYWYCEYRNLDSGWTAVLKMRFPLGFHTIEEWDAILEAIKKEPA